MDKKALFMGRSGSLLRFQKNKPLIENDFKKLKQFIKRF